MANREEKATDRVGTMSPGGDEQVLIDAAMGGDKKAFGLLIRRHQKRLFRFTYSLTGSFDATEDIVQEAFIKAYSARDSFKQGHDFYPWLATIARNLAFNYIKREAKKESLDQIGEKGFDPESKELGPLEKLISSEGQRRFYAALKVLPEEYRRVFVMRHVEEMDYRQIAGELNIPMGTVDSRLHRARRMLMEALKDLL